MELEVLSRNDHLEDLRQNCVHEVCRFCARKAGAPTPGIGAPAWRRRDQRATTALQIQIAETKATTPTPMNSKGTVTPSP